VCTVVSVRNTGGLVLARILVLRVLMFASAQGYKLAQAFVSTRALMNRPTKYRTNGMTERASYVVMILEALKTCRNR
jgi:hypothetical protein